MWLLEAIFIDPLTARFFAYYLPVLAILIVVALLFGPRPAAEKAEETPEAPRPPRRGLAALGPAMLDRLAALDITPNQVSYLGIVLVLANCGFYLIHRNSFWLGTALALSYLFDALDGVVARRQGRVSRFGGYLDAIGDRYQEIATYIVVAWVNDWWAIAFFVMSGSMLTSYNKARTAIEIPIDNKGWPDLLIRHRRLWVLCFGLMADASIPWALYFSMICLVVMTHFTAIQRFMRARRMLLAADAADAPAAAARPTSP